MTYTTTGLPGISVLEWRVWAKTWTRVCWFRRCDCSGVRSHTPPETTKRNLLKSSLNQGGPDQAGSCRLSRTTAPKSGMGAYLGLEVTPASAPTAKSLAFKAETACGFGENRLMAAHSISEWSLRQRE